MKKSMSIGMFAVVFSIVGASTGMTAAVALADDQFQAEREISVNAEALISELRAVAPAEETQIAVNELVGQALSDLRAEGFETLSGNLARQWDEKFSRHFLQTQFTNIGDHQPLVQFLADLYLTMHKKMGDKVNKLAYVEDINLLNWTIPVALQPKGDRRNTDKWDITEYRLHFVPFSQIITYYASLAACKYALKSSPKMGQLCPTLSKTARNVMGQYIAPRLSDSIYRKFNGSTSSNPQFDWDRLFKSLSG
ncbi:MAG: hypothetical protein H7222_03020 [Methylotenera sp.]|nr:hypothetical protein [Oligoflexia bacterium]